jgi:hypothetical protein
MSDERWRWDERGEYVQMRVAESGALVIGLSGGLPGGVWASLPPRACAQLATWLDGQLDEPLRAVADELEQQLRVAENERDEAITRAERAEARLAELVAEHRELAAAALRGGAR